MSGRIEGCKMMPSYCENPCSTCSRRVRRSVTEMEDGIMEKKMVSFCLSKRIFIGDRRGPCSYYEEMRG